MLNITLGTAGHIDHGKTALVKSLTGCETDRLKEEKERGMSIDLGYAPCRIADLEVGIVDVPGHEDFIKTMVAGACGMDGVILVVAADDGIMPQTLEHLDILTLLGLRHGLVALTKIDRVDAERLERVQADLAGLLRGTFLDGAPIVPLSNVTGEGFDPFLEALQALVRAIPAQADRRRLPAAAGSGLLGQGLRHRGGRHPHRRWPRWATRSSCCRRTSPAASGASRSMARRATPSWPASARGEPGTLRRQGNRPRRRAHAARLFPAAGVLPLPLAVAAPRKTPAAKWRRSEIPYRRLWKSTRPVIFWRRAKCAAAASVLSQLRTKRPIVAGPGDPFILRTFAPVQTIGGGTILEAAIAA